MLTIASNDGIALDYTNAGHYFERKAVEGSLPMKVADAYLGPSAFALMLEWRVSADKASIGEALFNDDKGLGINHYTPVGLRRIRLGVDLDQFEVRFAEVK